MTEWEKAETGVFYMPFEDPKLVEGLKRSQELNYDYNMLRPSQMEERQKMIRENFGKVGENFRVEQPFYADHWGRISVGENFYSNYNFKVLAGNKIDIGDNDEVYIDCNVIIGYGQSVVSVAGAVQESVTGAIESMTSVKVACVNVNVCGITRQ